jgi:hypothetical protein
MQKGRNVRECWIVKQMCSGRDAMDWNVRNAIVRGMGSGAGSWICDSAASIWIVGEGVRRWLFPGSFLLQPLVDRIAITSSSTGLSCTLVTSLDELYFAAREALRRCSFAVSMSEVVQRTFEGLMSVPPAVRTRANFCYFRMDLKIRRCTVVNG